jgi:hypothetical protein
VNDVGSDAEIQGEVAARAGGDDDERDAVGGRDGGDQGLGPVAASHAEKITPPPDGVLRQLQ